MSVSTYEEFFILQENLYELLEDIVNEVKELLCLASWWWHWGFQPVVRHGADGGANWCWIFENTPSLINQRNIHLDRIYFLGGKVKGCNFIAFKHLLVMVGFKVS